MHACRLGSLSAGSSTGVAGVACLPKLLHADSCLAVGATYTCSVLLTGLGFFKCVGWCDLCAGVAEVSLPAVLLCCVVTS
jgi:hypothetical protein